MKNSPIFVVVILVLLAGMAYLIDLRRQENTLPNVVLIYLDDSGYGDYEHNGNPTIKTPNLTALKQRGINFTQFYVTSPACSASSGRSLRHILPDHRSRSSSAFR